MTAPAQRSVGSAQGAEDSNAAVLLLNGARYGHGIDQQEPDR